VTRTLVYLFRHGEPVLAETRRFIGHLDVPLSPRGEAQCVAQSARLRDVPLAALYSSDLERARRSGELLGAPSARTPIVVPALREMAMGRWEGLTAEEIQGREPDAFATWMASVGEFPFPDGESVPDLAARAWPAFEGARDRARGRGDRHRRARRHQPHAPLPRDGVPLDRLLSFGQGYAAMTVLTHEAGRWALRRLNEEPGAGTQPHG
jgi:broad specificity phosphatase PhoE